MVKNKWIHTLEFHEVLLGLRELFSLEEELRLATFQIILEFAMEIY